MQEDRDDLPITDQLDLKAFPIKESTLRPIAFASSRIKPVQSRYSAQELECLGIVKALEGWRGIIEGSPIIVRTDHEPLKYLRSGKEVSQRLRKFVEIVEQYEPKIIYRTGVTNTAADALSRANHGPLLDVAEGKDGRLELSPIETGQVAEESEEHPIAELRPIILAHSMAIREFQTTDDHTSSPYVKRQGIWWKNEEVEGRDVVRRFPIRERLTTHSFDNPRPSNDV